MCLHWDHICSNICMITVLHACTVLHFICINVGIQSEFDQHNIQHGMNGEADNCLFVSMYVYMHLVFKELN